MNYYEIAYKIAKKINDAARASENLTCPSVEIMQRIVLDELIPTQDKLPVYDVITGKTYPRDEWERIQKRGTSKQVPTICNTLIDPLVYQSAIELGHTTGKDCRELMLKNGMTGQEADDVIQKAFAWRYKNGLE